MKTAVLIQKSGIAARTLRTYSQMGLIGRPVGKDGYPGGTLKRVKVISAMRKGGVKLGELPDYLSKDDSQMSRSQKLRYGCEKLMETITYMKFVEAS